MLKIEYFYLLQPVIIFMSGGGPRLEPDALSIGQQKNVHSLAEVMKTLICVQGLP